jgi:hypothetical protein
VDWDVKRLEKLGEFSKGKGISKKNFQTPVFPVSGMAKYILLMIMLSNNFILSLMRVLPRKVKESGKMTYFLPDRERLLKISVRPWHLMAIKKLTLVEILSYSVPNLITAYFYPIS